MLIASRPYKSERSLLYRHSFRRMSRYQLLCSGRDGAPQQNPSRDVFGMRGRCIEVGSIGPSPTISEGVAPLSFGACEESDAGATLTGGICIQSSDPRRVEGWMFGSRGMQIQTLFTHVAPA